MWWEILPSMTIMLSAFYLPNVFNYYTNILVNGTPHKRRVASVDDVLHYLRDGRLNGSVFNPYKQIGLDNLKDICDEEVKKPAEEECVCPPKA